MLRNNCWLCGCHREVRFEYVLTLSAIKIIMDRIRADPAQLAVLEAKRAVAEAKRKKEQASKDHEKDIEDGLTLYILHLSKNTARLR